MRTIRGILVEQFGSWRDLGLGALPVPQVGPRDILIAPEAASLNFPDLLVAEGMYQRRPPLPFFIGRDMVGRVLDHGAEVTGFKKGDRVAAQPYFGAFAEAAVSPATNCFKVPDDLDPLQAATLGTAFVTSIAAITLRGDVRPGERVLVTGAAGGVGSAAVQYARFVGATVVGLVSNEAKEGAARRAGADVVIRTDKLGDIRTGLKEALLANGLDGIDVVIDVAGGDYFDAAIRTLRREGRLVVVGFASGKIPSVAANYLLLKEISVVGSSIQSYLEKGDERLIGLMSEIYRMASHGRFKMEIDSVFPATRFVEAAERISQRNVVGKVVLSPMTFQ